MADDYWAPVFARLLEDFEFLALVIADTSENDLVSWIKPNRALFSRCARFIKKNRVLDKQSLVREILAYTRNDAALRKIILYTWVEKNQKTMQFPTLPLNAENEVMLQSGGFGSPAKIKILAEIDPRTGVEPVYERVLASFASAADEVQSEPETESGAEIHRSSDNEHDEKLAARVGVLEGLLESFKTDKRQLKKQLEQQREEINAQNRRIEDYSHKLKNTQQIKNSLEHEITGLRSRISFLEKRASELLPVVENVAAQNDSEQLAALGDEIKALRRALENREATIRRLEADKAELAGRQASESDKERQISALRQRLTELEPASVTSRRLAGRLISTHKEPGSPRSWLFMSISGQIIFVDGALVSRTSLVREEFCLLQLDSGNNPTALESLENDTRREIFGYVESVGDDFVLVADRQRFRLYMEAPPACVDVPVRGVWLPEFAERPAGIYGIEPLTQHDQAAVVQKAIDIRQIKAFFRLDMINIELFLNLLKEQSINFEQSPDGSLVFLDDYRKILEPLRMHVRVCLYCDNADCNAAAADKAMSRQAVPGQCCDFCKKSVVSEISAGSVQFSGQRVLIFGGDYVGSEYERSLRQHNLNVEWYSGFKNIAELKSGLGHPDLVLIIVRQISHTLLRELVAAVARDSLPVLYSSRRGISGVLSDLTEYFISSRD